MGCHSANLVRWNRLQQIGLDDKQIKEFLIFGNQKVGDTMSIAMTPSEAKAWFGKVPPDLSVITRARTSFDYKGTDYIYTLLRGYYRDNSTATGWNNIAYPNIGMPHIFWDRQGPREATLVETGTSMPKPGMSGFTQTHDQVFDAAGQRDEDRGRSEAGTVTEGSQTYSFKAARSAAGTAVRLGCGRSGRLPGLHHRPVADSRHADRCLGAGISRVCSPWSRGA